MKILIVTTIVLFFAGAISSCKKSYTCTCTKTYAGSSMYGNNSTYTYKDTKKNAEASCKKNETSGSDSNGSFSTSCSTDSSY